MKKVQFGIVQHRVNEDIDANFKMVMKESFLQTL